MAATLKPVIGSNNYSNGSLKMKVSEDSIFDVSFLTLKYLVEINRPTDKQGAAPLIFFNKDIPFKKDETKQQSASVTADRLVGIIIRIDGKYETPAFYLELSYLESLKLENESIADTILRYLLNNLWLTNAPDDDASSVMCYNEPQANGQNPNLAAERSIDCLFRKYSQNADKSLTFKGVIINGELKDPKVDYYGLCYKRDGVNYTLPTKLLNWLSDDRLSIVQRDSCLYYLTGLQDIPDLPSLGGTIGEKKVLFPMYMSESIT